MNFNIPLSEIMTTDLVTVSPGQKLIDVKHIFEKKEFHHHIPVAENGMLIGMVSLIDFLFALKNGSLDDDDEEYHLLFVKDIMRERPYTLPSSSSFREVVEILGKGHIHAIVIADGGKLKGIISTTDVIRFFLKNG